MPWLADMLGGLLEARPDELIMGGDSMPGNLVGPVFFP
jgi:hypothetical protein